MVLKSIKDIYKVESIKSKETYDWLMYKHYAKRIPSISYAFGLFKDKELLGICTFGSPASPNLCVGVCGMEYKNDVLELNRLCIQDKLEKNIASYFVSSCLNMFNKQLILVSYADTDMHHNGYVYQATNWLYTGLSQKHLDWAIVGRKNKHIRHTLDLYGSIEEAKSILGKNLIRKERPRKHRYIYFNTTKKRRKELFGKLLYKVEKYPKNRKE